MTSNFFTFDDNLSSFHPQNFIDLVIKIFDNKWILANQG